MARAKKPDRRRHDGRYAAQLLVWQLTARGQTGLVTEHRFDEMRRWRFDLCVPQRMVAAEIDGGVWTQGRHTRGSGFIRDLEKINRATELGWRVFRYTPKQVVDGIALRQLERVLRT